MVLSSPGPLLTPPPSSSPPETPFRSGPTPPQLHPAMESAHHALEEGTYHKRLFRGPNTNDMKKWDGPSLSWPTPHTTRFFLPPEDPFPVLLRHNSTPLWEPDPALARLPRQQQAGTGHGRPERAPGRHRRAVTPPPQRDCLEAVS